MKKKVWRNAVGTWREQEGCCFKKKNSFAAAAATDDDHEKKNPSLDEVIFSEFACKLEKHDEVVAVVPVLVLLLGFCTWQNQDQNCGGTAAFMITHKNAHV